MCNDQIYSIANIEQVHKRVNSLKSRSEEVKSRVAIPLKQLWNPERTLKAVPLATDFSNLKTNFPQFKEVIEFYECIVFTMYYLGQPFEAPPVLLQGDPGLGKTYFVSELAKLLQLPFYEISMATMTASFVLSGGSLQWSEGEVGLVAKALADSPTANPIILIDEVDKCSSESRHNAINVLYGLLEPHSAKRFKDEALEFDIDASRVLWIGTGNYIQNIPPPIRSRMRIFEIRQPEPHLMPIVVQNIYLSIRSSKSYGKLLDDDLNGNVLEVLSHRSPRDIRLAIEESAYKAIREHRSRLSVKDIPEQRTEGPKRVGFY